LAVVTVGAPGGAEFPGRLSAGRVGGPGAGRAGGAGGAGRAGGRTGARPSLVRRILPGLARRSSSSSSRLPSVTPRCPGCALGGLGPVPGLGGSELRKAIHTPDT